MGYSATTKASFVLDEIIGNASQKVRGVLEMENNNCWRFGGKLYFFERGSENADGSITGTVFRMDGELAKPTGTVRIEPDGTIVRFPTLHWTLRPVLERQAQKRLEKSFGVK
jgi:hypothetical protein